MKSHTIKLKQNNMLCHKCLLKAAQSLSQLPGIEELDLNLNSKVIKVRFKNDNMTKDIVRNIVDKTIISGKVTYIRNELRIEEWKDANDNSITAERQKEVL